MLLEEASLLDGDREEGTERKDAWTLVGGKGWSRTLNRWCGDTSLVQYAGNPPPTLGRDMTPQEYAEIPGTDDIMTKVSYC